MANVGTRKWIWKDKAFGNGRAFLTFVAGDAFAFVERREDPGNEWNYTVGFFSPDDEVGGDDDAAQIQKLIEAIDGPVETPSRVDEYLHFYSKEKRKRPRRQWEIDWSAKIVAQYERDSFDQQSRLAELVARLTDPTLGSGLDPSFAEAWITWLVNRMKYGDRA